MNGRSQMQGGKNWITERDKCKPVLPRLALAGNLEKNTYVPLWDRMEGAWLLAMDFDSNIFSILEYLKNLQNLERLSHGLRGN
jgi:hypothetical protein